MHIETFDYPNHPLGEHIAIDPNSYRLAFNQHLCTTPRSTLPLRQPLATGLLGSGQGRGAVQPSLGGRPGLGHGLHALGRAVLLLFSLLVASLYGAVWVMEAARLPQITQLVFHLVLALVAMFGLRVAVQMALLREAHDPATGQPVLCVHCDRIVPEMPFCPFCGAASRASSRLSRRLRKESPPVPTATDVDGSV